MLYLIDANVLVTADKQYYPLDRVPQFWDWIIEQAEAGNIRMPFEIYDEISQGNDELSRWIKQTRVKDFLILDEEVNKTNLNTVLSTGYANDLSDTELSAAGRDPFLIAYAYGDGNRVVVTKEVSRPSRIRGRRKVPDACNDCSVNWMDDFALYRTLDFRIVS